MSRPQLCAKRIRDHIRELMADHAAHVFEAQLGAGKIFLRDSYVFPTTMAPTKAAVVLERQLYERGWDFKNQFEFRMAAMLAHGAKGRPRSSLVLHGRTKLSLLYGL